MKMTASKVSYLTFCFAAIDTEGSCPLAHLLKSAEALLDHLLHLVLLILHDLLLELMELIHHLFERHNGALAFSREVLSSDYSVRVRFQIRILARESEETNHAARPGATRLDWVLEASAPSVCACLAVQYSFIDSL